MLEVYSTKMTTSGWKGLFRQKNTPPSKPSEAPQQRNLNMSEAAEFLQMPPSQLLQLSQEGSIRRFRTPNGFVYRIQDLESYKGTHQTANENVKVNPHDIQWKDMESTI